MDNSFSKTRRINRKKKERRRLKHLQLIKKLASKTKKETNSILPQTWKGQTTKNITLLYKNNLNYTPKQIYDNNVIKSLSKKSIHKTLNPCIENDFEIIENKQISENENKILCVIS